MWWSARGVPNSQRGHQNAARRRRSQGQSLQAATSPALSKADFEVSRGSPQYGSTVGITMVFLMPRISRIYIKLLTKSTYLHFALCSSLQYLGERRYERYGPEQFNGTGI